MALKVNLRFKSQQRRRRKVRIKGRKNECVFVCCKGRQREIEREMGERLRGEGKVGDN